jgi:carboxyl-terminal processing protease
VGDGARLAAGDPGGAGRAARRRPMVEIAAAPPRGGTATRASRVLRCARGTPVNVKILASGWSSPSPSASRARRSTSAPSRTPSSWATGGLREPVHLQRASAKEVRENVLKLRGQGMKKLILDLRENSGRPAGPGRRRVRAVPEAWPGVVETRGRTAADNTVARARGGEIAPEMPIVVLVDEYSASAAEIVAGRSGPRPGGGARRARRTERARSRTCSRSRGATSSR